MHYTEQEKEEALKRRDLSALTNMINDGIDINSLVVPKNTDILLAAINKENRSFFTTVLSKGFKCKNQNGFLYLHHAIRTHDLFFVKKILEQYKLDGLSYNEYTTSKDNCLHIAVGEDDISIEVIKYLTECGIKWSEQNVCGETPLHVLLRSDNIIEENLIQILKNQLNIFYIKDNTGKSPLDIIQSCSSSQEWSDNNNLFLKFIKEVFNA